jgi:ABC-type phosphate/phosphonate transport system substrate-binding protein
VRKKRALYFVAAVFILAEAAAIFYACLPLIFSKDRVSLTEVRLGVAPEFSGGGGPAVWASLFKDSGKWGDIEIVPYYANSIEEALAGFTSGSFDLLYINPAIFLRLRKDYAAQAVVFHKLSPAELESNRAVIVSGNKKIKYFEDSRGSSLIFSDERSMSGCIIPREYLLEKTNNDLKSWFSQVSFSESPERSAEALGEGRADLAAFSMSFLKSLGRDGEPGGDAGILWMSMILPENLIAVSPFSPLYGSATLEKIQRTLWEMSAARKQNFNKLSMLFEPVSFDYLSRLEKLEKYLSRRAAPAERGKNSGVEQGD